MKPAFISQYDLLPKLRLYSGIILMLYAFTHLLNHAIGLIDLNTIESGRLIFVGFWRHPLMSWVVPTSIIVHFLLVLHKIFRKTTFKGLNRNEWGQIVLGLIIPLILVPHIIDTRVFRLYAGTDDNYSFYVGTYYPTYAIEWFFGILIMWGHGVIGLNFYLKQKPWFVRFLGIWRAIYISLPLFAFFGIVSIGKEIQHLKEDPSWFENVLKKSNPEGFDFVNAIDKIAIWFSIFYLLLLIVLFTVRSLLIKKNERKKSITINYLNGESVSVGKGTSLLEASLKARIPHAHVCGGRGRCSTCRVQVIEGIDNVSQPGDEEIDLLKKVNVGKNVRLACKTIPFGPCTVYPLLPTTITTSLAHVSDPERQGVDKEIAILFSDLRGFTALTEHKLPYDVVHLLNQYYQFMGQAIEANGGRVDKFIGDGIMALFGLDSDLKTGCAQALAAAKAMSQQLDMLNESLKNEIDSPLRLGIGIHCGSVIVGEMGYRNVTSNTAIGDVVNTASRLESESKTVGCELVVSEQVALNADANLSAFPTHELQVRGRSQPLRVYSLKKVSEWAG